MNFEEKYFESIDSTQIYCRKNYKEILAEKDYVVVRAGHQSNGIGRLSHTWKSECGNIFATFCLKLRREEYLKMTADRRLIILVSLSVCHTLESFGFKSRIKFVNDVLINGKKISGCMADGRDIPGSTDSCLLVGVGVNVNLDDFKGISQAATSMKIESGSGRKFDVSGVYRVLKRNLEVELERARKSGLDGLGNRVDEEWLYSKNESVNVLKYGDDRPVFSGVLKGMNDDCSILVENVESGEKKKFPVGPFQERNMEGVFRIEKVK